MCLVHLSHCPAIVAAKTLIGLRLHCQKMPPKQKEKKKPSFPADQATLQVRGGQWSCAVVSPTSCDTPQAKKRDRAESLEALAEEWSPSFTILKRQRQTYDEDQRTLFGKLVAACDDNVNKACRVLKSCGHSVDYQTLKRALEPCDGKRSRGRPVDAAFEAAVLSKCIFQVLSNNRVTQDGTILANILHSLQVVVTAGLQTKVEAKFRDNAGVQKLQCSLMWARGVVHRHHLRKRRVTTSVQQPQVPSPQQVRTSLRRTQDRIDSSSRRPCDIISADETGVNYCVAEKFIYAPQGADRPPADGDDKVRVTGMLAGSAVSDMLPAHVIIKCDLKDDGQQAAMRVLDNLLAVLPQGQWELKTLPPFSP